MTTFRNIYMQKKYPMPPQKTNKEIKNPSTVAFHMDQNKQIRKKKMCILYFATNKYEKKNIPEALPFITNSDRVERNFRVK